MKKPEGFTKESSQIAKGVGILWLLAYHLFSDDTMLESMGVSYRPFSEAGFLMFASFGKICVAIFVMLTSYGISKGIFDKEIGLKESLEQAFGRFLKLCGRFVILFVSVLCIFGWAFDLKGLYGEAPQGIIYFVTDALGLSDIFGSPTLNGTWWYMCLAYGLIFLVPFGAALTKKSGYGIIPLAFFLPVILSLDYTTDHYLFTAALGVACAYGDWFNKLLKIKFPEILQWIIGLAGTVLFVFVRDNALVHEKFYAYADAFIAFFIIWTAAKLVASVPVLRETVGFVGKHSLYIFLIHSFFYLIVLRDVVYHFKPAGVTYLILLILSLAFSVVLEGLIKGVKMLFKRRTENA